MNRAWDEGVLYHAVSAYQLLEVCLHRRLFHREDRATLLLPDFIVDKYPQWRRLRRFFQRVELFPYLSIPHGEEAAVAKGALSAWEGLSLPPLERFSKRYVAGAHFYFSLCLLEKGLPFSFFEDAAGALGQPERAAAILGRKYPGQAAIARRHGLFSGECPLIREVFCCGDAQPAPPCLPVPVWDFSVERALLALSPWERGRLRRFFLPRRLRAGGAQGVLLTQQFAGLGLLSAGEQRALYRSLARGPLRGVPLLVKNHPDDPLDYAAIFPGAGALPGAFPAELLPYAFWGKRPRRVYAFDSSSLANLSAHFQTVRLDGGPREKGDPWNFTL